MTPNGRGVLLGKTPDGKLIVIRARSEAEMAEIIAKKIKDKGPTFPPEVWEEKDVRLMV